jgi:AcrR family transcriptional regulator
VPRLWSETVDAHRRAVGTAILDTTAALVAEHGPAAVTMSQIAEHAGIGRATLYKYFPDVESILVAWHDRQVAAHVAHLAEVRDRAGSHGRRLEAVLTAYAMIAHEKHDTELAALLHQRVRLDQTQQHLYDVIRALLVEAASDGAVRDDVAPDELARYCLHALTAAGSMNTKASVHRLVRVTLDGLAHRRTLNG